MDGYSVSVNVFCAMIRVCEKEHGIKLCGGESIEKFRQLLAEAEAAYASLPDAPAKKPRRKKGD